VPIAYRRQENSDEVTALLKALIELQTSQYNLLGNVSMKMATALRHSAESIIGRARSARVYGAPYPSDGEIAAPVATVAANISRAQSNSVVLATGSGYIAYSTDGGNTFASRNPTSIFPSPDDGFCRHPIVQYAPGIDRFVWIMQFDAGTSGQDHLRVAAASPQEVIRSKCTAWTYWDLRNVFAVCPQQQTSLPGHVGGSPFSSCEHRSARKWLVCRMYPAA
jgi:hypothetical protein